MGESYYAPGRSCDVGTIEAAGGDTWKAFCDCNFTRPGVVDKYFIDGIPVIMPLLTGDALFTFIKNLVKGDMRRVRIESQVVVVKSDEWYKCIAKQCLLPSGCWNAARDGWDPFNVHPGMLAAPWTEFGAAARGIQKADAGFFYMIGQLTSIDISEYEPIKLWKTYWENPAKYALLMLKFALFVPGGAAIVAAINNMGLGAGAPPIPILAAASAQSALTGTNFAEAILIPMAKGSAKWMGTVIQYLGRCGVGVNLPCGAGIIVQRAAQDQVDTGEINKIGDPTTRAIVAFLARSGADLTDAVMKAATGALSNGVWAVLESGFYAAADAIPDAGAKSILRVLALGAGVGYVIASGIGAHKDVGAIADDVADKLLGFRPSVYFALIKTNAQAAASYVKAAQQVQGTTFEKADALINAVMNGLNGLASAINALNTAIGGGLENLSQTFSSAAQAMSGAASASKTVNAQVLAAAPYGTSAGPLTVTPPGRAGAIVGANITGIVDTGEVTSLGTLLAGAGIGAAVGGPAGALAGLVAGLVLDKKSPQRTTSTLKALPAGVLPVKPVSIVVGKSISATASTAATNAAAILKK